MRVRGITALIGMATILLLATACGSSGSGGATTGSNVSAPPTRTTSTLPTGFSTVTPGVLTVATNLPGPGFWDGNSPSTITGGYEYGMAKYMAQHLGLKLKIINVGWDALVSGEAKGFDLALSTINVTPQRAKVALFSQPYMSSDQGVLVRAGTTVTSANARSLKWGVEQGSTSLDYLASTLKPSTSPAVYQDQPSMFAALAAHQIDAVLLDTVEVLAEAKQAHGALKVVGQYHTGGVYGALLPKGSPDVTTVNTLIHQMQTNGTLKALSQQYLAPEFGQDPTTVPYLQP
jgi:ABC-type amino acid transport substrate-binding protein